MSESFADAPLGRGQHTDLARHDVPADDSPVPAGPATVPWGARPWQGPDRLVLRAPFGRFALPLLIAPVLIGAAIVRLDRVLWGGWGAVPPIALPFVLLPAALMAWFWVRFAILPRVTFDKEAGLLTLGWRGLRGRRPLSSVIGVQVMRTRKQFGAPEHNIRAVVMYQLNLILDDPAERRLNVTTCDLWTARSGARLVADFLGVPVLDCAGTPAAAAVTAAAEPLAIEYWAVTSPVVTEPSPHVLLIRPRRLAFLGGFRGMRVGVRLLAPALAVGLAMAAWGVWAGSETALAAAVSVAVLTAVLCFCLLMAVITTQGRVRFDRACGVLTLKWMTRRTLRTLASVKAVEVEGGPNWRLNLLPRDPRQPRLNLIADADAALVRGAAERVASFLGVPLLDRGGTPAAAAATAAAERLPIECWTVPSPVVTEPGPDVLLIRSRRLALPYGVGGMGLAGVVVLLLLAAQQGGAADWFLVVALMGAPWCFLLLQRRQARFDRARGVLTLGRLLGRRPPRRLASVKAVEVVEVDSAPYCQLNLLPDDPRQPQLNLITDADASLVRGAAARVASFLGVPLLGVRPPTPAAAPSGGGEAVNPLEELNRSALPTGSASVRGPACVVPKGDDVLVLRPRVRLFWVRLASALLPIGLGLYVLWLGWQGQVGLGQSAVWLLLALVGEFSVFQRLLWYRDHFDRQAGLLTLGWFGLKGTYPLAKVLAVQLVPGGLFDKAAGPFERGGERVSYQMNLVVADAYQDRLNLTDDSDLEWTRGAGQQLADFLGVPLIDQIADGD